MVLVEVIKLVVDVDWSLNILVDGFKLDDALLTGFLFILDVWKAFLIVLS